MFAAQEYLKRSPSAEKGDVEAVECAAPHEADVAPPPLPPEQERRLWRKVDKRILPILTIMYLCSFLDRGAPFLFAEDTTC